MSNYKAKGTITAVLPAETGTSKAGRDWKKQAFVMQTEEQYPQALCFTSINDRVELRKDFVGATALVDFDIRSREYTNPKTGRTSYIVELVAWKMEVEKEERRSAAPDFDNDNEDLPF